MSAIKAYFKSNNNWSKLSLLVISVALIWTMFNLKLWNVGEDCHRSVINQDVTNYYSYLPAAIIYDDLSFNFVYEDGKNYGGKCMFWPVPVEGRDSSYVIKMSMGMSVMYAPFFLMAHGYTTSFSDFPADGFSQPYEFFIVLACVFYVIFGFFFLRKLLLKYFDDAVTAVVILLVLFGTNLYFYSSSEPGMSHAFSFALVSAFAYYSVQWLEKGHYKYAFAVGVLGGLIVLIRPVNILVFIFPALISVQKLSDLKSRWTFFIENYKHLIIILITGLLIVFPQLLFWKINSGHWIYYSYNDEHFFFKNPQILEGLFGFRKGWLVYTPIMIFSLIGLIMSFKLKKEIFWSLALYLPIHVYVIYSWWCWWYGGSFGSRPMIEAYGLLAIPLGVWVKWLADNKVKIISFTLIGGFLVWLNLFQTAQYRYGAIHFDGMTSDAYWHNFGVRDPLPGFWEKLNSPDYDKAKKGIYD